MMFIWIKFLICAGIILYAGSRVSRYGDIIAEKTGLGGLWVGLILLALATSLPEVFTGVGSILFVNAPDLTVGNLFGANSYNLLNISLLDLFSGKTPILSGLSQGQFLLSALSLIPLMIAGVGILLTNKFLFEISFAGISIYSFLILASYIVATRWLFVYEKNKRKNSIKNNSGSTRNYGRITIKQAYIYYGIFAAMIIGAGIWLAYIGKELATVSGLQSSFIGSLLIGFSTTLPEIVVSISALRLGAREMAIANMLGSNLFNMAIIFINDTLYRQGSIFRAVSFNHVIMYVVVLLMTFVVIVSLLLKPKKKAFAGLSWYSICLIAIFAIGAYVNFICST